MKVIIQSENLVKELEKRIWSVDDLVVKSRLTRRTIDDMIKRPGKRFAVSSAQKVVYGLNLARKITKELPQVTLQDICLPAIITEVTTVECNKERPAQ